MLDLLCQRCVMTQTFAIFSRSEATTTKTHVWLCSETVDRWVMNYNSINNHNSVLVLAEGCYICEPAVPVRGNNVLCTLCDSMKYPFQVHVNMVN